jgi:hypothetical protein
MTLGLFDPAFLGGLVAAPWTPADIATALWLDAADAGTITESGGAVSEWRDKSGNSRDVQQATAAYRPTYSATAWQSSLPGITFSSYTTTTYLENASLRNLPNSTIISVYSTSTSNSERPFGLRSTSTTGKQTFAQRAGDNSLRYDGAASLGSIAYANGSYIRVSTRSTSAQTDFLNGTQNINDTQALPNIQGYYNVGGAISTLATFFQGVIVECIALEGIVSTTDRQKLEGYLAHKWGLAASLPAAHPYKNSAP